MEQIRSAAEEELQIFQYIFENTVRECNRVLKHWEENDKKPDYDDKLSLFRSFLAKFFKQKYSWIKYKQDLRIYNPLCTIAHNRIVKIDLNPNNSRKVFGISERMNKFLKTFDCLFEDKQQYYDQRDIDLSQLNKKPDLVLSQINFKQLENIKF